jgi:hypothetical protein
MDKSSEEEADEAVERSIEKQCSHGPLLVWWKFSCFGLEAVCLSGKSSGRGWEDLYSPPNLATRNCVISDESHAWRGLSFLILKRTCWVHYISSMISFVLKLCKAMSRKWEWEEKATSREAQGYHTTSVSVFHTCFWRWGNGGTYTFWQDSLINFQILEDLSWRTLGSQVLLHEIVLSL